MKASVQFVLALFFSVSLVAQDNPPEFLIATSAGYSVQSRTLAKDLDEDGVLDLITLSGQGSIAWYKNLGEHLFSERIHIADSLGALGDMMLEDLDGDADLDILFSSRAENNVAWLPGNGNGQFGEAQTLFNFSGPESIDIADLDGDGDQDILVASIFGNEVSYMLNNGFGVFYPPTLLNAFAPQANSVRAGDLDGDGDQDVVYAMKELDLVVWQENLGEGTFAPFEEIADGISMVDDFLVEDLDGDGDLDIAIPYFDLDHIRILTNNGEASFPSAVEVAYVNEPVSLSAADMNDDGLIDLLVVAAGDDEVLFFENNGSGQFPGSYAIAYNFNYATSAAAADINNDGQMDCVYHADAEILYKLGDGSGEFHAKHFVSSGIGGAVGDMLLVDYNQDGMQDVLYAGSDDRVCLFRGTESGSFDLEVIGPDPTFVKTMDTGDLDGDGDLDIALTVQLTNGFVWMENLGGFEVALHEMNSTDSDDATDVRIVDLNQDGMLDLVTFTASQNKLSWLPNLGGGMFGEEVIISNDLTQITIAELIDFNGDGSIDISTYNDGNINCFLNDGTGAFNEEINVANDLSNCRAFKWGDVDNDGDLDAVAGSSGFGSSQISWFENQGDNTFLNELLLEDLDGTISSFELRERNEDNQLDVIFSVNSSPVIYTLLSSDVGQYSLVEQGYSGDESIHDFILGDIDNNGTEETILSIASEELLALNGSAYLGCTNTAACNYSESATEDNGSCCFDCGCEDEAASNYDPMAECGGGTCNYLLAGLIFYDENENGVLDNGEQPIPYQTGSIQPANQSFVSDANGMFQVVVEGQQSVTVEVSENDSYPFNTTPVSITIQSGFQNAQNLAFGLSNELPSFEVDVHVYSFGSTYPCDDWVTHNLCVRNSGTLPVDIVLEWSIDPLFQDFETDLEPDSVVDDVYYYSFSNVQPWEIVCTDFHILTPTVDEIGAFLTTSLLATSYLEGEEMATGQDLTELELACAYDPNDKQVFPLGYSENHYIAQDEVLEYLVRFQNTGNAPATDIHVLDTLDLNLDISKFELLANSHSVQAIIDQNTRVVDFYFENIMLPDSVNNEPESHGFVSFQIEMLDDLPLLTEINNTAGIYFDNNPPIITNTTWSTIYDCSLFEASFAQEGSTLVASEGDAYQWYVDGLVIEGAIEQTFDVTQDGEYAVEVMIDFPCIKTSESTFITNVTDIAKSTIQVYPNPTASVLTITGLSTLNSSQVALFDVSGREVLHTSLNSSDVKRLDVRALARGSYQMVIWDEVGVVVGRTGVVLE